MPEAYPVLHLRCPSSDVMAGGAIRVVWQIARNVDRRRFPSYPCFVVNALAGERSGVEEIERDGVPGYRLRGGRFLDFRQLARVARLARRLDVRIIHCHDYKADIFALLLRPFLPGRRLVTTLHGYIANSRRGRFYCALDRHVVGFFDRVLVVASPMLDLLPRRARSRALCVHNALDVAFWQPSAEALARRRARRPGGPLVIGYAGRVSREKGWQDFVRVIERVVGQGVDARCIVAGDGPEQEAMRAAVRDAGLAGRFQMLGGVENMRAWYDETDLLLAPSHTEGLPLVQLEACAMAVPVVATQVGGVGDLIVHGENGLLAPARDIEALAAHVLALEADPARAADMGEAGVRRVRAAFSSDAQARRIEQVYESVLGMGEARHAD